jgi:hypothetical protein
MTTRRAPLNGKSLRLVITRDAKIPLSTDDPDMDQGWRCVPIPADRRPPLGHLRQFPRLQNYLGARRCRRRAIWKRMTIPVDALLAAHPRAFNPES